MAVFFNNFKTYHIPSVLNCTKRFSCQMVPFDCGVCRKFLYMDPRCKVAVITGGTTALGVGIAQELLCNALYRVILTDLDTCKGKEVSQSLNSQYGPNKTCFMSLDTYKLKDYQEVLSQVIDSFGNVDILINSPGIPRKNTWEEEINARIMSVIRGTMTGTGIMSRQRMRKGGIIINLSSTLAFDNMPHAPIYVSGNNGVVGLSKAWGATPNYLRNNVRVVTMCTGLTEGATIENTLSPGDREIMTQLSKLPSEKANSVGRGIVYMIQYAPSGTVWYVEKGGLYRARLPNRIAYSKEITFV